MQHVVDVDGRQLVVLAVNLAGHGEPPLAPLTGFITDTWTELAPFISCPNQVLYIRDIPAYTIDGLPGGHAYVPNEAQVALPDWAVDQQLIQASIAHELHHIGRWQNAGYGSTLGEAIVTEGLATVYEELKSGRTPPWATAAVTPEARAASRAEWDSAAYDHGAWFFRGPYGRWAGYAIGYELISTLWNDGFDLEASMTANLAATIP